MALDFFAGCLGGCAGIVVGYPLDTIKVHIQTQDHRNPKYKGTWHCFKTILARDSITGLYKGMSSPVAGVALVNAIIFGVYGQSQKYLQQQEHFAGRTELTGHFLAGVLAGVAQAPVCSPMELAKTRMQLESGQKSSGPLSCLLEIKRSKGLRGLFNGLGITVLREAPSFGVYFVTYELLAGSSQQQQPIPTWLMLLAGGLAGSASWLVSYPLDVVKSRLQADTGEKYSGALDCLRKSLRSEGYGCLYRGLNLTIVRAFPTNAATFAVVAWTMRLLGAEQQQQQPNSLENRQLSLQSASESVGGRQAKRPISGETEELHGYSSNGGSYLRQLQASAGFVLAQHQHAGGMAAVQQIAYNNNARRRRHFDEMHYFESVRETLHY